MPFTFTPLSDEEIQSARNAMLMPEGVYKFKIKDATQEVSKVGNSQIKVTLGVLDQQGDERTITDYLVGTEKMIPKLKSFCECIGLISEYEKGSLEVSSMWDKTGHAKIGVSKGGMRDDGGYFNDKNNVKSYIKPDKVQASTPATDTFNDDVIF